PVCLFLFVVRAPDPPALHSFPTRRSSDLGSRVFGLAQQSNGEAELIRRVRCDRADTGDLCPVGIRKRGCEGELSEPDGDERQGVDRKSTRLNSSHVSISYAVFCLKKKTGM